MKLSYDRTQILEFEGSYGNDEHYKTLFSGEPEVVSKVWSLIIKAKETGRREVREEIRRALGVT